MPSPPTISIVPTPCWLLIVIPNRLWRLFPRSVKLSGAVRLTSARSTGATLDPESRRRRAAGTALTVPDVLFSGSNDGALRAHATRNGSVIWEYDTNRSFTTVNGVHATGGSIQGPGPTVVGGMLFLNAGHGDHMGRAGNVLLAFDAK